jgi:hypothetical protein
LFCAVTVSVGPLLMSFYAVSATGVLCVMLPSMRITNMNWSAIANEISGLLMML